MNPSVSTDLSVSSHPDVVIVGAGNAAACAALAAREAGVNVIMLEAAPVEECGGNSRYTAGITRFVAHADLDGLDDSLIDDILATNVRGAFAAVRALRPLLQRHGDGLVINMSSIAATTATGSNIMYCASKAALDNMTKSLARALAPAIRVVSLAPGLVDTEFVKQLDQAWRDDQAARTPLKRLALPEEVARAVVVIATGLTFTTGAIIPVDGGRPLG